MTVDEGRVGGHGWLVNQFENVVYLCVVGEEDRDIEPQSVQPGVLRHRLKRVQPKHYSLGWMVYHCVIFLGTAE